jgi:hypothetical protein
MDCANVVYAMLWSRDRQIEPPCRLKLGGIGQQRPDTKWVVHLLTNVTFYLNKLIQHPIRARVVLPDFFLRNQGLVCLAGGAHGTYEDNLCFFSRTPGAETVVYFSMSLT